MGCWNETCGISQLPIQYGDKVRVFILANTSESNHRNGSGGFCYSDECWSPYGLSIQGKYDDYGSVEKVKNNYTSKLLLNTIINNIDHSLAEDETEEARKYRHVNLEKPQLTWTEIVTSISQEEIRMKNVTLGLMFVLEDIYQAMISMDRIVMSKDKGGYLYQKLSELLSTDAIDFFNKIQEDNITKRKLEERINLLKKEGKEEAATEIEKLSFSLILMSDLLDNDHSSIISSTISNYKSRHFMIYKKAINELISKNKTIEDKDVKLILTQIKEHCIFNSSLSSLRKSWSPQCGKGSQDSNFDAHLILNSAITKFCNDKKKEYEKDGGTYCEYSFDEYQLEHNEKEMKRRKLLAFA